MPTLAQGRIVWASVSDPQGRNPKDRPLVILSDTPKDSANDDLIVVAVTTQSQAPAEHCVALPWSRSPGCLTKLTEPSAAVCSWTCSIKKSEVRRIGGLVPPKIVQQILAKIEELQKSVAAGKDKPAP